MNNSTSPRRYAIYFAPTPSTRLDELGRGWLGRDTRTGEILKPKLPEHMDPEVWRSATEAPRRYGFHATLKPPFALAQGTSLEMLQQELTDFAKTRYAFPFPPLIVGKLGSFLALVLSQPCDPLHALAADCVRQFDSFRAQPKLGDLSRRLKPSLNIAERTNLMLWGYPYVLDTWKFHMTLTGSLPSETLHAFEEHLVKRSADACNELTMCDAVCLFEEPEPNAPLLQIERYAFHS